MLIAEKVKLSRYINSLDGSARWLIETTPAQLKRAIDFANNHHSPWIVVPEAARLPWPSDYFDGVVIVLKC